MPLNTATVTPVEIAIPYIAEMAVQAAFKVIADQLASVGYPVSGDFAPEEVDIIDAQFEKFVRAMALNNPDIATMQKMGTWTREFGLEYAVPDVITNDPELVDVSWHNDVCPSFALKDDLDSAVHTYSADPANEYDGPRVRLWVEHPDPEARETGRTADSRYFVADDQDTVYHSAPTAERAVQILKNIHRQRDDL